MPSTRCINCGAKRRFTLITSEAQLAEFRRTTRYPKLRRFLKAHEAGTLVRGLAPELSWFQNFQGSTWWITQVT